MCFFNMKAMCKSDRIEDSITLTAGKGPLTNGILEMVDYRATRVAWQRHKSLYMRGIEPPS